MIIKGVYNVPLSTGSPGPLPSSKRDIQILHMLHRPELLPKAALKRSSDYPSKETNILMRNTWMCCKLLHQGIFLLRPSPFIFQGQHTVHGPHGIPFTCLPSILSSLS